MTFVELACGAILALYVAMCGEGRRTLVSASVIAAGAWLGEDTCIRVYGFYDYAPGWHLWLDRVPAVIVLVWPAVVLSARSLVSSLAPGVGPARAALLTGAVVTFDAALIEPIAVHAGLWTWHEPGIFGVPPIGILGWGFFGASVTWTERAVAVVLVQPFVAALLTHVALITSWWGALRWVGGATVPPAAGALAIAAVSVVATAWIVLRKARVRRSELVARAVATLFFVGLLLRGWDAPLALYAAAFTLPHLALSVQSARA